MVSVAHASLFGDSSELRPLAAKLAMSLLRYTTDLPCDKFFYLAGKACQKLKLNNMAFVFFDRYLDLSEVG